jgi:rhodanese-related sulfurtransferase
MTDMDPVVATISAELKGKIDRRERFDLVEALPASEYQKAHLPGAINLPPGQARALAPRLLPDKRAEIVVYCSGPT